jgi:hypothetical protein
MKRFIEILVVAVILIFCFLCFYAKYKAGPTATKNDLQQVEQDFNRRLDSVISEMKQMNLDLDTLKADADTLKAGQKVIFKTMKENQGKSLFEYLFQ